MATSKMIQTVLAVAIATSAVGGGLALSGGAQLWAQDGNDPFAEVVVRESTTSNTGQSNSGQANGRVAIIKNKFQTSTRNRTANQSATKGLAARIRKLGHFNVPVESEAEVMILETLRKKVHLSFDGDPLQDVAMVLQQEHGIPVHFDRRAIEDVSIDPSSETVEPIDVANISLANALKLILQPMELTTVIRNEVLMITTEAAAESTMLTRVYKIDPNWEMTQEQMLNAITTSVASESWTEVGGPGSATAIQDGLVISNSRETHDSINKLLGQIDKLYQQNEGTILNQVRQ